MYRLACLGQWVAWSFRACTRLGGIDILKAMSEQRGLSHADRDDRLARLDRAGGFRLPPGVTVEDVLAQDAALLASEGIGPAWPGLSARPAD